MQWENKLFYIYIYIYMRSKIQLTGKPFGI